MYNNTKNQEQRVIKCKYKLEYLVSVMTAKTLKEEEGVVLYVGITYITAVDQFKF